MIKLRFFVYFAMSRVSTRFLISSGIASLLMMICLAAPVFSQNVSRWALGRPSMLIDMPGDPGAGGVAWAEKPMYSIFPNAWSSEGGGVRIEVARVYTSKSPTDLLAQIGQNVNTPMTPTGKGQLSGREFVNFISATRMTAVIGNDGGVLGGASWVVMATYKDEAGQALAGSIFDSIKVEREGARHWVLRSLGPTFLAAELPFEMTQVNKSGDAGSAKRYETSFDGMDIRVTEETPGEGNVFEKENTLKDFIEGDRSRPGVTGFSFTRDKYKLGDQAGDIITKDFKRGGRSYRIYEIAFIEKRRAVIASIQIDPTRGDHQKTTERILRTLKTTLNPVFGWKTYAVGDKGLYIDLPVAPAAPKQQNAVTIYESNSPLAMTEIRELEVGFPAAHNPDFAAKQYFEMRASLDSKYKFEIQGIDRLLVDGLEARLVRSTWRNGENVNQRQVLIIYGYQTQWIVDMLAAKETAAYMERVMQSVRVKIDFPPNTLRQSIGTMGVSMLVGDKRIESKVTQNPNDPDFSREESATAQYGSSLLTVYEMVFKNQSLAISDANGKMFIDSFLRGLGQSSNLQITATQRDSFAVNIDGVEGRHIIYDLTANNMKAGSVIQADFVMLTQDKKLWTAIVLTNYEGGLAARYNRAMLLNSLRVGI